MQVTHHFDNEYERVLDLESYRIMDTGAETGFDLLTSLAGAVCETPIAFISFIDSTRQWFKASVGIDIEEVPRYLTACNETIEQEGCFILTGEDLESSAPYAQSMKKLGLYYYAGVPILSSSGRNIGTLCVMDYQLRELTKGQIKKLLLISKQITKLLELRNNYLENLKKVSELQEEQYISNKHFEKILYMARRKSIAELSNGICHKINEHLTTIENVYQNLQSDEELKSSSKKELEILRKSCRGIESVLDHLNEYIEAAVSETAELFSVKLVLHEVLKHMEYKFEESPHIECQITYEEELKTRGNVAQFAETLYAVIQNAIDAVQDLSEGKIEISLRRAGKKGLLDVKDTGLGITDSVKPFLFQPFFTTKNKINSGTGLSLGQSLLEKQGAEISLVKSANPTTFRITFDLA